MNPDAPFLTRLRQHRPVIGAVIVINAVVAGVFVALGWDEAAFRQVVIGAGSLAATLLVVAFSGRRPW